MSSSTSSLHTQSSEVIAWLEYKGKKPEVDIFLDAVESYPTLQRSETTYGDELRAREMRRSYPRLESFDRVYLAQMEWLKVREIYSNDRGFDRVRGVNRIFE